MFVCQLHCTKEIIMVFYFYTIIWALSLAPEVKPIKEFKEEIEALGLSHTNNIIRIKWTDPTPFSLIDTLIKYNLEDKAGYTKFWR